MIWVLFLATAGIIVFAGTKLAFYGDVLAEKTGLGRTWMGLVLVAATTSLPELFTGIGSVALFSLPDIALGNILGACMLNLLIVSFLDLVGGKTPISAKAGPGHLLSIGCGSIMMGILGIGFATREYLRPIGWVGWYTLALFALYPLSIRLVFLYERRRLRVEAKEVAEELHYGRIPTRTAIRRYAAYALVIIGAAIYLPRLGERIAVASGLGQSFVGSLFIAITTTLPELIVSLSAARLGAVDLALGNLFGSVLFNLFILALDDLLFVKGPLLSAGGSAHLLSIIAVVLMNAVLVVSLTYQALRKRFVLAWDTLAILIIYLAIIYFHFSLRSAP
jgi:cation:H+ antiporter